MKEDTKTFIKQLCSFSLQISTYLIVIIIPIALIGLLVMSESTPTDRYAEVYNSVSGEVIWTYEGSCNLTERKSTDIYTITFRREDGTTGRADFAGSTIAVTVVDK